ncbi:hypothetical protein I4U23_000729 [Adineta vaga]|nr:hypothetical protein I4U23_000729 [Adineta vaga]
MRFSALLLVVLIVLYGTLISGRTIETIHSREKRLFSCAKVGKKCTGFFGKSCCGGTVCHSTFGKCVRRGSSTSWLGDRNGK